MFVANTPIIRVSPGDEALFSPDGMNPLTSSSV